MSSKNNWKSLLRTHESSSIINNYQTWEQQNLKGK